MGFDMGGKVVQGRLNLGPVPTTKLDWLQPHEGNIIDFLYRSRALQMPAGAGVA